MLSIWIPSRRIARLLCTILFVGAFSSSCSKGGEIVVPPKPKGSVVKVKSAVSPKAMELFDVKESTLVDLNITPAMLHPPCREQLEDAQGAKRKYPFRSDQAQQEAAFLFGCGAEARHRMSDGSLLLAYALSSEKKRASTLRVSSYDKEGVLKWQQKINRSAHERNFIASLKGSFIAPVLPLLVCAGSMWPSEIQVQCMRQESGEIVWSGTLPFWSGIKPQGAHRTLYVADVSGIRRIYPWEGVEMRKTRYGDLGGRASFYETDGKRLFFASRRGSQPIMTAFDFKTMKPLWKTKMKAPLEPFWAKISIPNNMVFGVVDNHIVALDLDTGELKWRLHVGKSQPDLTATKDAVYVMVRRDTKPNLLWKVNPKTGAPVWGGKLPSGVLEIQSDLGFVMLKSIQATSVVVGKAVVMEPDEGAQE